MDKNFVILGEASESDGEDEEKTVLSVVKSVGKPISASLSKGVIVAGEASESESESEENFREAFFARSGVVQNDLDEEHLQSTHYDTLLHKKLRECNRSLHNNVCTESRHNLSTAIRALNSTNQQLLVTQIQVQDAATSLSRAFHHLTKLNDSLNALLATPYIPEITI
uniref:Biogenesis of lysosome-related organelles complex 1 subunit 3 n=1 Tax=Graphocephala atropunctata TaxID=36148 RepID=A0A1B6M4X8_9HEMI